VSFFRKSNPIDPVKEIIVRAHDRVFEETGGVRLRIVTYYVVS